MRLILSGMHPRNSTYTTEGGQILYKVHKPHGLGPGTATIRKAVGTVNGVWQGDAIELLERRAKSPFSDKDHNEEQDHGDTGYRQSVDRDFADSDPEDGAGPSSGDLVPIFEGHFAFYAQVEFRTFKASRFRYNGLEVSVDEFFRKEDWSLYGRGRVFKASDGNEYRWELRASHLEMIKNDGSKKQVVRFREWRPNLGRIMKGRPASLEVDSSCEPILDEIMMTFVYCHKLRKDREEAAKRSGGGG